MSLADKPVYPSPLTDIDRFKASYAGVSIPEGITLLQHYAGMAMQGILGCESQDFRYDTREERATAAVKMAKALIAELEKEAK